MRLLSLSEDSLIKSTSSMKRLNNLHKLICTASNVELADDNARKCKPHNWGVKKHDKHRSDDNDKLLKSLEDLTYKTSEYSTFKIYEPKERLIFRLPYYPDRIAHHAIMNVMEPVWVKTFIHHTYSCIKGRGIHRLVSDLSKILKKDIDGTKYCLKLDIKKFYPSIDHDVLKSILRRKIKDKKLLVILDEIVDSTKGVPIGNYLSQFFANLVLTYFDHWMFEEVKLELKKRGIKLYYFRYADDIVILSNDKEALRGVLALIKIYFHSVVKLELKGNYQIFPVDSRGIDFVGYKFYHTHILIRKSMKYRILRLVGRYKNNKITSDELKRSMSSYFGWLKYCNSKHLLQKIEQETGLHYSNWNGLKSKISLFYKKNIRIVEIVPYSRYFRINFVYKGKSYTVKSKNKDLYTELFSKNFPLNYKLKSHVRTKKNRIKCSSTEACGSQKW